MSEFKSSNPVRRLADALSEPPLWFDILTTISACACSVFSLIFGMPIWATLFGFMGGFLLSGLFSRYLIEAQRRLIRILLKDFEDLIDRVGNG